MTTKAIQYLQYGEPSAVRFNEIDMRALRADEVLVQTCAVSVNPLDWKLGAGLMGNYLKIDFPFIPGVDLSGRIEAVGADVQNLKVNDLVYGGTRMQDCGTFAERAIVKADVLVAAPKSLPLAHAAAVPLAALTAWFPLTEKYGDLKPGGRVLIHGGAGGVGNMAIQLAKMRGAYVYTTASEGNLDFVRSLGADVAIDYRQQKFEEVIPAGSLDLVLDLVGPAEQARSYPLLKPGGKLASVTQPPAQEVADKYGVQAQFVATGRDPLLLSEITRLIDAGKLRVVIAEEFALADAGRALTQSQAGHARGKLLLRA